MRLLAYPQRLLIPTSEKHTKNYRSNGIQTKTKTASNPSIVSNKSHRHIKLYPMPSYVNCTTKNGATMIIETSMRTKPNPALNRPIIIRTCSGNRSSAKARSITTQRKAAMTVTGRVLRIHAISCRSCGIHSPNSIRRRQQQRRPSNELPMPATRPSHKPHSIRVVGRLQRK